MKRFYWLVGLALGCLALHEILTAWVDSAQAAKIGTVIERADEFSLLIGLAWALGIAAALDLLIAWMRKWNRRGWKIFAWIIGITALLVAAGIGFQIYIDNAHKTANRHPDIFDQLAAQQKAAQSANPQPSQPAVSPQGDIFDQLAAQQKAAQATNQKFDPSTATLVDNDAQAANPPPTPAAGMFDDLIPVKKAEPVASPTPKSYPVPGENVREILVESSGSNDVVELGAAFVGRTPCKVKVPVTLDARGNTVNAGRITITVTDSGGMRYFKSMQWGEKVPEKMFFQFYSGSK